MKIGKVEKYIHETLEKDGAMLFILIDPCDHPSPEAAADVAQQAVEGGADLILVGGSIGAQGELMETTTKMIKEKISVPINIFPGNNACLTPYADSVYFMSMLNSRNNYWTTIAQTQAAPVVARMKLEPLPTGYIVVEPGGTVGWVGDANLIPRGKPHIAAALAMAGQFLGSRFILTDAGSAPKDGPIPVEMVKAVSAVVSVPYVVAGGIRKLDEAKNIIAAGADAIHIGTAMEASRDIKKTVEAFVKVIKEEGKKKK